MSWYSKVVWSEGMFLRPQHFQQQDRYIEAFVRQSCGFLRPYDWGVTQLVLDRDALALGKVALTSASGLLPDGTPFSIPDHDPPPVPLDIDADMRDTRIMLVLPLRRTGMAEVERGEQQGTAARYRAVAGEVRDNNVDTANNSAFVEIGEPRLRLFSDTRDLSEYTGIGIARVLEKRPDQAVVLDSEYLPPCLDCRGVPRLNGFVTEVLGLLHQRGDALADRVVGAGTARGASLDIAQFLRLQVVNRFEPLFAHLSTMQGLHPEAFYQVALELAGEMATFTDKVKRRLPPLFPAYDHDNLRKTLEPVLTELRRSLSLEEVDAAIQIPLEERQYGIRVGIITDRERPLLAKANFILAVRANVEADQLRTRFPPQLKIGPVELIAKLINHHLPGIGVSALPVAPREIPYRADFIYFRLDRGSEFWKQLLNSGGFAFFVGGEFPDLEMVFWAIKE